MSRAEQIEKMRELTHAYSRGLMDYQQYKAARTQIIDEAQADKQEAPESGLGKLFKRFKEVGKTDKHPAVNEETGDEKNKPAPRFDLNDIIAFLALAASGFILVIVILLVVSG